MLFEYPRTYSRLLLSYSHCSRKTFRFGLSRCFLPSIATLSFFSPFQELHNISIAPWFLIPSENCFCKKCPKTHEKYFSIYRMQMFGAKISFFEILIHFCRKNHSEKIVYSRIECGCNFDI